MFILKIIFLQYYDALPNEVEARAELAKMEVSTSQMVVPPPPKLEKAPPPGGQSQGPNSEQHHIPKSEHVEQNVRTFFFFIFKEKRI